MGELMNEQILITAIKDGGVFVLILISLFVFVKPFAQAILNQHIKTLNNISNAQEEIANTLKNTLNGISNNIQELQAEQRITNNILRNSVSMTAKAS